MAHAPMAHAPVAPQPRHHDRPAPHPLPLCTLGFANLSAKAHLVASVDRGDGGDGPSQPEILGPTRRQIEALVATHQAATTGPDGGPDPDHALGSFSVWGDATDLFLAEVYHTVSAPLLTLLARHGALGPVALDVGDPLLGWLPIETAHDHHHPALFELVACHRVARRHPAPARRQFTLHLVGGDERSLVAAALERELVAAAHHTTPHRATPPHPAAALVHRAGHWPVVPEGSFPFTARHQAHLVLSGCSSLIPVLPAWASSATCSLWPVDDTDNATFMAAYHARLAAGVGPAEALRQAQFLHRSLPTTTWAAYVHLGCPH